MKITGDERIGRAIEIIQSGKTVKIAAESVGMVYKTLLNKLRQQGFDLGDSDARKKPVAISDGELCRLYKEGTSVDQIVRITKLSRAAVYYRLHKAGCIEEKPNIDKNDVYALLREGYCVADISRLLTQKLGIPVPANSIRSVIHRLGLKASDFKAEQRRRKIQENRERLKNF